MNMAAAESEKLFRQYPRHGGLNKWHNFVTTGYLQGVGTAGNKRWYKQDWHGQNFNEHGS